MSGGTRDVQATFWLLDAPASLLLQSDSQPDGVGLGTFDADGLPSVYRKPVAANRSQTFIAGAQQVRSRTFLAHIRHATGGGVTIENTHPFEQHGRLLGHNGVVGDLDELRARLGDYADLVHGSTDSELFFGLITRRI
jgi:predicted glutamine amidotransferase